MEAEMQHELARLVGSQRTAALGTLHDGAPGVSMVLYAVEPGTGAFLLHLSRLAAHTGDLLQEPRVALLIQESDEGTRNPQTLVRVSLSGLAALVPKGTGDYNRAKACYLARHPKSKISFELDDFELVRVIPEAGRFVAGFARAHDLESADLARLAPPNPGDA